MHGQWLTYHPKAEKEHENTSCRNHCVDSKNDTKGLSAFQWLSHVHKYMTGASSILRSPCIARHVRSLRPSTSGKPSTCCNRACTCLFRVSQKKSHLTLAHGKIGWRQAAVSVGMDGARGALFAVCRPLAHGKGACLSCALGAAHGKGAWLSCALDAAHGKRFCHRVP